MPARRHVWSSAFVAIACLTLPARAGTADLAIGDTVPDFTATSLDGSRFRFEDGVKSHRAVVVLFLSTVCPYANHFGEHVRQLAMEFGRKGVIFVAVDSNASETADEVGENARRHGYTFSFVKDDGHRLADLLGARRTPEAFLVDDASRLRYHGWIKSKIGSTELKDALDAVLGGRKVRKPETPAFGCVIDR